jgi:hypothetical protein
MPVEVAQHGIITQSPSAMRQALEGGPGQDLVVTVELVMTRADDIIGTRTVGRRLKATNDHHR